MKVKIILSIIGIMIIGILAFRFSQRKVAEEPVVEQKPLAVTTQSVRDSATYRYTAQYPAIVAGDQQITVTAGATGTITSLNFDLGSSVGQNQRIATIDITGTSSEPGENGLKSSHVRALEFGVESAEKSYKKAKDAYKEADTYANKKDKEIAKIAVESAEAALQGALDGQNVTTPITGTVIERSISLGDAVVTGQKIATVSKTGLTKIQFYVTKDELAHLKMHDPITIHTEDKKITGTITAVTPQADPITKRFLIEARPQNKEVLTIGSVYTVSFDITRTAQDSQSIIVPLAAVTVGQNESYVYITQNDRAKRSPIVVNAIIGETAEITGKDFTPDTHIIIDGSKLIQDDDPITITQ